MTADALPGVSSALRKLAELRGVGVGYVDGRGATRSADVDILMAVLNSFGDMDRISSPDDARTVLRGRRQQILERILEPVYVVDEGVETLLPIRPGRKSLIVECRVEFEFGGEITWSVPSDLLAPLPKATGAHEPSWGLLCRRCAWVITT